MNDAFDFSSMQKWLAEELKIRAIYRPSQILYMTEEQLRVNGILTLGIIRNLSIHLEKCNVFFKNGEKSITRLHLHKNGLWMLIENGITELTDLEEYSQYEVANDLGFGDERAEFIAKQMEYWGYKLRRR